MHYIVTGCNGKLGGRTAELMLQQVAPADLTFTCPSWTVWTRKRRPAGRAWA